MAAFTSAYPFFDNGAGRTKVANAAVAVNRRRSAWHRRRTMTTILAAAALLNGAYAAAAAAVADKCPAGCECAEDIAEVEVVCRDSALESVPEELLSGQEWTKRITKL